MNDVVITGPQLRAARGLLNMSVTELAQRTALAVNTIKRAEGSEAAVPITTANAALLRTTMEQAGVIFIEGDQICGPGVRLASSAPPSQGPRRRRRSSAK